MQRHIHGDSQSTIKQIKTQLYLMLSSRELTESPHAVCETLRRQITLLEYLLTTGHEPYKTIQARSDLGAPICVRCSRGPLQAQPLQTSLYRLEAHEGGPAWVCEEHLPESAHPFRIGLHKRPAA